MLARVYHGLLPLRINFAHDDHCYGVNKPDYKYDYIDISRKKMRWSAQKRLTLIISLRRCKDFRDVSCRAMTDKYLRTIVPWEVMNWCTIRVYLRSSSFVLKVSDNSLTTNGEIVLR